MVPRGLTPVALQVLPDGLVVPPLPYLAGLAVALALVGGGLYSQRPPVTRRVVVAFGPWMVTGAALHAFYQLGGAPTTVAPLLSAPTVYATTFLLAGGVWALVVTLDTGSVPELLGGAGVVAALAASGIVVQAGAARGTLSLTWPVTGLLASIVLSGAVYGLLRRVRPSITTATGSLGALVVFGHVLDGVSTTIGVDLLDTAERSPIPRAIMDVAGSLPTEPVLGTGWLFVLVKVGVAVAVLALFVDFVEEDPVQGNAALGVVAAVGLGPGAHNLLLFAAAGPV
ncbi:DUF63 family protein [Halorientalis salina]|uniref:DUF63 family protein n=1 Tax=Halorientalis salina TaxID=2932266 RepID=UPI0010AB524B|nr:DUF63 family protein [Halorientalis salina]